MSDISHLWSLCLAGAHQVTPAGVWHAWSLAPAVLLPLAALLALGLRSVEVQRRSLWFVAGWTLLAVALVSPLCRLSATLVSAHMVQLMLLVGPATLLLALGGAGAAFGAALAHRLGPLTALYGLAIWLWHLPAVYDAIVTHAIVHWLAFATLIGASVAFWSAVVASARTQAGGAVAALLTTLIHTGLLGALLTFAARPFYPILADGAAVWGLTPLQDQQLAGLVMWVCGGVFYLLAAVGLCAAWLRAMSRADAAAGRL